MGGGASHRDTYARGERCVTRQAVEVRHATPAVELGSPPSYSVIAARAAADRNMPPAECATPGTTLIV